MSLETFFKNDQGLKKKNSTLCALVYCFFLFFGMTAEQKSGPRKKPEKSCQTPK